MVVSYRNILRRCAVILILLCAVIIPANSESVKPTFGVELDRRVFRAKIEDKIYFDVVVKLKASSLSALSSYVKIVVKDTKTGKHIYKKRFNSYLYGFSDGTIVVGKGNVLTQLILQKLNDVWILEIRKGGIY